MSDNTYNRYYGPGSNIWPALRYLKKKGATSAAKAISLDQIESEDFRQLLRLNSQTSFWIVVTPEGKYWVRTTFLYISYGLFAIVFIGILLAIILTFTKVNSFSTIFDLDEIKEVVDNTMEKVEDKNEEMENLTDN
jgi:hypothetical protein